jgi:DNA modification methylase
MTITWQPVTTELSALVPWEHNPKTISKPHAKRLLANWQELGQWQTIAIGPAGEVYDGHQRLSVLKAAYGDGYQVKALQSSRALNDEERGRIVFEGTAGAVGQIDWEVAASFDAGALQGWGMDADTLRDWKRDTAALDNFLKSEAVEPQDADPQIDRAAELNEKWQVKTGDLWRIGEHRLLCGDSTKREDVERVMDGERAELAPVDPPYNVGFEYDGETVDDTKTAEKYEVFSRAWFGECQRVSDRQIVTPGCNNLASWMRWFDAFHWAPWVKTNSMTNGKVSRFWCWEPVLFFGEKWKRNRGNDIFDFPIGMQKDVANHPCPKPLKMWTDILENYSEEGAVIFESFGGSGTTMAAGESTGRITRLIEISPNYCAVILERMSTAFPGIEIERIE